MTPGTKSLCLGRAWGCCLTGLHGGQAAISLTGIDGNRDRKTRTQQTGERTGCRKRDPDRHPLDTVRFPPTDIAAIGRGFGCGGVTVRGPQDLAPVREWLAGPRDRPLVIDAKITSGSGSWWLEEAFRGH